MNSLASGYDSTANGAGSAAIGQNSTALGANSVAAANDTAVGYNAIVYADGSVAVGSNSSVTNTGTNSVALGAVSVASADRSVAIGQGSVADQANTVSVGSAGNERRITNVADGTAATDAVNYQQLQAAVGGFQNAYHALDQRVNKIEDRVSDVGAISSALSALVPSPHATGNTHLAIGLGYYRDSAAVAAGLFYNITNNILVNAGVSTAFNHSETAGRVGACISW
jgi:autotransporter adhesin